MGDSLIIGGAGFIGHRLARRLVEGGEKVTVADLVYPDRGAPGVDYRIADARELTAGALPAGPETTIYHFAALHRTPGHEKAEYFNTNLVSARRVADFAAAAGVRRFVFTSSIAVYGPGEEEKDETARPTPVTSYGWSKLLAEQELMRWATADPARRLIIARPAVVFGPGERGNFTRLAAALARRVFAYPGRRDTVKGCCYVDDLIDSFAFALAAEEPLLVYNFAYPEPYSIEAICDALHREGGLPRPLGSLPRRAVVAAAAIGEALDRVGLGLGVNRARVAKLTRSTRVAPRQLTSMGYQFPTDLSGGLRAWRNEAGEFR